MQRRDWEECWAAEATRIIQSGPKYVKHIGDLYWHIAHEVHEEQLRVENIESSIEVPLPRYHWEPAIVEIGIYLLEQLPCIHIHHVPQATIYAHNMLGFLQSLKSKAPQQGFLARVKNYPVH